MSKYLSKADFLVGITLKPVDFEVDGLGTVLLRGLSVNELQAIRAEAGDDEIRLMVLFACRGLVEPSLDAEEIQTFADGDAGIVTAIGTRVVELTGVGSRTQLDPLAGNGS
jgi:hypothetical protein